jgi:glycosyltransferase involved in cell wall biosynthesis
MDGVRARANHWWGTLEPCEDWHRMVNRISVVMCTHNGKPYVLQQLESLAAQTRLPDVLQVWDDCSEDSTASIVRAWSARAPFPVEVRVHARKLGVIKNFEYGVKHARGDLIALSDQDDVWHRDKLERAEAVLTENPGVGLVFSDASAVGEHLQHLGYTLSRSGRFGLSEQRMVARGSAFDVLLRRNVVMGASLTMRASYKSLLLPIPQSDVQLHDAWIAFLMSAVDQPRYIPEPLLQYRQVGGQLRGAHRPTSAAMLLGRFRTASFNSNQARLESYVTWLTEARQRLVERADEFPIREGVLLAIDAKQHHLLARLAMPQPRARRLSTVAPELLNGNYHRYSIGIWDAARDLIS